MNKFKNLKRILAMVVTVLVVVTSIQIPTYAATHYVVTFHYNYDGANPEYETKETTTSWYNEYVDRPTDPIRTGYQFDCNKLGNTYITSGWYTDKECEHSFSFTNKIKSDTHLYAKWKPNTYYVKYYGNDSTSGDTAQSNHTYDSELTLTPNGFSRTGYNFVEWNTKQDGTGIGYEDKELVKNLTTNNNETVSLYAQWAPNVYTVTLESNGGTGGTTSVEATYGAVMPEITCPTKTGSIFQGYFDATSDGRQYYNADGSSAHVWDKTTDTTLYAQWKADNVRIVTFDLQGHGDENFTQDVPSGNAIVKPDDPVDSEYTFCGWFEDKKCTTLWNFENTITENKTLYAKWKGTLNDSTVTMAAVDYNAQNQEPVVKFNDTTLVKGQDYTTTFTGGTNADTYQVEIVGMGEYAGTVTKDWTINKIDPTYKVTKRTGLYYNTTAQDLVEATVSGGTIVYQMKKGANSSYADVSGTPKGTLAGTDAILEWNNTSYFVRYKVQGDNNHNSTDWIEIKNIEISKTEIKSNMISINNGQDFVYTGKAIDVRSTVKIKIDNNEVPFSKYENHMDGNSSQYSQTNVGEYKLRVYINGTDDDISAHDGLNGIPQTWKIVPADLTNVNIPNSEATYTGSEQTPSVVGATATTVDNSEVTWKYSTEEAGTYSENLPKFKDAGAHKIYYKASAKNHNDATGSFIFTINKAELEAENVKLLGVTEDSGTFTPQISVKYNNVELTKSTDETTGDYILTGDTEATGVGTYKAKVVGINNFKTDLDGIEVEWKVSDFKVSFTGSFDKDTSFYYDKTEKQPFFTVYNGVTPLTLDGDYTIDESSTLKAKDKGMYTIKVNGINEYDGCVANISWSIIDAEPAVNITVPKGDLTYSKASQKLVTEASTDIGKLFIRIEDSSNQQVVDWTEITDSFDYSVLSATNAGTYNIYYKVLLNGYEVIGNTLSASKEIKKKTVIPIFLKQKEYSGQNQYPEITGFDGFVDDEDKNLVKIGDGAKHVSLDPTQPKKVKNGYTGTYVPVTIPDSLKVNYDFPDLKYEWVVVDLWFFDCDSFDILPLTIQIGAYSNLVYNGQGQDPGEPSVANKVDSEKVFLTYELLDKEGQATSSVTDAGTYNVNVTGIGGNDKGNYRLPATTTTTVTIDKATIDYISLKKDEFLENSRDVTPEVEHVYANYGTINQVEVPLSNSSDGYVLSGDTTKSIVGKYTIKVGACNDSVNFIDASPKASVDWEIKAATQLTSDNCVITIPDLEWTGTEQTNAITSVVYNGEKTLEEGVDYEVDDTSTLKGTEIGEYSVSITGKGLYKGTVSQKWKITEIDLSNYDISLKIDSNEFTTDTSKFNVNYVDGDGTKNRHNVEVKVSKPVVLLAATNDLVEGQDYTVTGTTQTSEAGEYELTITGIGNYTGSKKVTWKINKINPTVTVVGNGIEDTDYLGKVFYLTYTGTAQELLNVSQTSVIGGTLQFKINDLLSGDWLSINDVKATDVRYLTIAPVAYDVFWKVKGDSNHNDIGEKVTNVVRVKINKAKPTLNMQAATGLVYTGSAQDLFVKIDPEKDPVDFGELKYSSDGKTWETTIPSKTDAGSYSFYYKLDETGNYDGISSKKVEVTIAAKTIKEGDSFTLSAEGAPFSGNPITPTLTVKDNDRNTDLVLDEDYEIVDVKETGYATSATDIGEYKIRIQGKGNYQGIVDLDWKISGLHINFETDELTYNTSKQTVSIASVTNDDGEELVEGEDYKIDVANSQFEATDAGTYSVRIEGLGKYDGYFVVGTWKINPAQLSEGDLSYTMNDASVLERLIKKFIYNGKDKGITGVVQHRFGEKSSIVVLTNETDYTVEMFDDEGNKVVDEEDNPITSASAAGKYKLVATGTGNYTGTIEATWEILGLPMDWVDANLSEPEYTYDGKEKEPKLNVGFSATTKDILKWLDVGESDLVKIGITNILNYLKLDSLNLKEGVDYKIITEESTLKAIDAGEYKIVIKGLGKFTGKKTLDWKINKAEIQKDWVYTGATVLALSKLDGKNYDRLIEAGNVGPICDTLGRKSNIFVKKKILSIESDDYLTKDVDYEFGEDSVFNSSEPGLYHVYIKGKGNYTGDLDITWTIGNDVYYFINDRLIFNNVSLLSEYTTEYNGDIQKLNIKVSKDILGLDVIPADKYTVEGAVSGKDAGAYSFTVKPNEGAGFYGDKEITWKITPRNVLYYWDNTETTYNGEVQRPNLVFKHLSGDSIINEIFSIEGTDEEKAIYENYDAEAKAISLLPPKNAGTYEMFAILNLDGNIDNYKFIGVGGIELFGEKVWFTSFKINQREIGVEWIEPEGGFLYNGLPQGPIAKPAAIEGKEDTTGLVEGDVCLLNYKGTGTNVGTYTAKVTGILFDSQLLGNNYVLTTDDTQLNHDFAVIGRDIANADVFVEEDTYDGTVKEPKVTVRDGLLDLFKLTEGTDYIISYEPDVINAGTYDVTITGIGNYAGSTTAKWVINPATPKPYVEAVKGLVYNANEQMLIIDDEAEQEGNYHYQYFVVDTSELREIPKNGWTDDARATNAGIYYVYYKVVSDSDNYKSIEPSLLRVRRVEIDKATLTEDMVIITPDEFTYDGEVKEVSVSVQFDDGTVVPEKDYHVCTIIPKSDLSATDAGKYDIYITTDGLQTTGNFKDEGLFVHKEWKINKAPIKPEVEIADIIYGELPGPNVKYGTNPGCGKAVFVYSDTIDGLYSLLPPINAGEYYVKAIVAETKNYLGGTSEPVSFKILPKNIKSKDIDVYVNSTVYDGTQKTPYIVVKDGFKVLRQNVDYTVTYKKGDSRKDAGKHTVYINGIGNYKDTLKTAFEIYPKVMSLGFDKWTYISTYGDKSPNVKVNMFGDVWGDKLNVVKTYEGTTATGKHYESTKAPKDAGWYTVTATLSGKDAHNYVCKPITTSYVVLQQNIERTAEIKLTEQLTYNGKTQTQDFVVYAGKTKLKEGRDYVVLHKSDKARDAGEYTLKIKGIGNYTGILTEEFTVKPKTVKVSYRHTPYNDSVYMEHYDDVKATIKGKCKGDDLDLIYTYVDQETFGLKYRSTERPTNPGKYFVIASLDPESEDYDNYKLDRRSAITEYKVKRRPIDDAAIELLGDALVFGEGDAQDFIASVEFGLEGLEDFHHVLTNDEIEVSNVPEITGPGVYELVLKGKGNFKGEASIPFLVLAKDDAEAKNAGLMDNDGNIKYGDETIDVFATSAKEGMPFFKAEFDKSAVIAGSKLSAQELSDFVNDEESHVLELFFVVSKPEVPATETTLLEKKIGNIFDIEYFKRYDYGTPEELDDSGYNVKFTVGLTPEMENKDENIRRDYTLITQHSVFVPYAISSQYNTGDNTITFAVHEFSKFYVGYLDVPVAPRTSDSNNMALWFIFSIIALLAIATVVLYCRKRKED